MMTNQGLNAWVVDQVARFESLANANIRRWTAREIAILEHGPSGSPQFEHPDICFLQLLVLHATLTDGRLIAISTYQDGDQWGLSLSPPDDRSMPEQPDGIFRTRELTELPTGEVRSASIILSERGNISEVILAFDGSVVTLVSGEVYEQSDGSLRCVRDDESVLVFIGAYGPNNVKWYQHR
jgi:hypothetical protein